MTRHTTLHSHATCDRTIGRTQKHSAHETAREGPESPVGVDRARATFRADRSSTSTDRAMTVTAIVDDRIVINSNADRGAPDGADDERERGARRRSSLLDARRR